MRVHRSARMLTRIRPHAGTPWRAIRFFEDDGSGFPRFVAEAKDPAPDGSYLFRVVGTGLYDGVSIPVAISTLPISPFTQYFVYDSGAGYSFTADRKGGLYRIIAPA